MTRDEELNACIKRMENESRLRRKFAELSEMRRELDERHANAARRRTEESPQR